MSLRARQCRSMLPKAHPTGTSLARLFFPWSTKEQSWGPKGSGCTIRQSSARPLGSTSTCNRSATEKDRGLFLGVWLMSLLIRGEGREKKKKEKKSRDLTRAGWWTDGMCKTVVSCLWQWWGEERRLARGGRSEAEATVGLGYYCDGCGRRIERPRGINWVGNNRLGSRGWLEASCVGVRMC